MSAPMMALTKKDSGWKEGKLPEEAYIAFLGPKEKLMQQPIVAYPKQLSGRCGVKQKTNHLVQLRVWRPLEGK
jgi:hypothetical protein